jgi:hypothetical protein
MPISNFPFRAANVCPLYRPERRLLHSIIAVRAGGAALGIFLLAGPGAAVISDYDGDSKSDLAM